MNLSETELEVRNALAKLSYLFVDGVKLSFVMRHPDDPECWMFVSDDDPKKVAELIAKSVAE